MSFETAVTGRDCGQENALQALLAKLATPFPQHILIYARRSRQNFCSPGGMETVKKFPDLLRA
jgi:ATP-dependent Lon protease